MKMALLFVGVCLSIFCTGCDVPQVQSSSGGSGNGGGPVVSLLDVHSEDDYAVGYMLNHTDHSGPFTVCFNGYDSADALVHEGVDTVRSLSKNEKWKFKVWLGRDSSKYKFAGVRSRYGMVQTTFDKRTYPEYVSTLDKPETAQEKKERLAAEFQDAQEREKRQREKDLAEAQAQADRMAAIAAANQAKLEKIIDYQTREAKRGLPSFQLLLGKRYLTGDGVETNLALARHWLQSAATNGEPVATNLLSRLQ